VCVRGKSASKGSHFSLAMLCLNSDSASSNASLSVGCICTSASDLSAMSLGFACNTATEHREDGYSCICDSLETVNNLSPIVVSVITDKLPLPGYEIVWGRTMWIEEVAPERLAELFHHYHQALEGFGKESQSGSWKEIARPEKDRLVTEARLILLELDSTKNESAKSRRYFAEPGRAEWGC
jgi:hypothetical protein